MRTMGDTVCVCTWSRSLDTWTLWVKSRPAIRGVAANYAEAEEQLIDAIRQIPGVTEAVPEFDPPLPRGTFNEKIQRSRALSNRRR